MTVAGEEIRLQLSQIQRNLSDAVGAIDQTQHALLPANPHQLLEREADPGVAHDGIKDSNADTESIRFGFPDRLLEPPDQLLVADGVPVLDLDAPDGGALGQRDDGPLDGPVDGGEVDDDIALLEEQVPQDGVDARRRILDQHALLRGDVQEFGHGGARHVQALGQLPAEEHVRTRLIGILELAESVADGRGIRPE
ncbi:hypothetical protein VTN02DRAFT_3668 [Thermoascus thermophilus]